MNTRQRKLIRMLNGDPKTVSYYAKILNVSERTVHNDLKIIDPIMKNMGLELIRKPGIGIYSIQGEEKIIELADVTLSLTPPERQVIIFEQLLLKKEKVSLERLSEQYYISPSSIRNDLAQIEHNFLGKDTLRLIRDSEGTYLVGSEEELLKTHIKFCQYIYLNSEQTSMNRGFYRTFRKMYSPEIVDSCLEAIEEVEQKNITFLGDHYRTNLLIILLVLTYRVKTLGNSNPFIYYPSDFAKYKDTLEFSEIILRKISNKMKIRFSKDDYLFLNMHLKGLRVKGHQSSDINKYEPVVKRILDSINSNLGIDVSSFEYIEQQLMIHINSMLYRVNNDIAIKNKLTQEIRQEYLALFNSLWIVLNEELEEHLNNKIITEDEVAFIVIYLQTILNMQKRNKRVLIICPNGISTSQLLVNKLTSILPPMEVIETTSVEEAESMDLSQFDFVITTTNYDAGIDNIIQISPLLTNHDITKITSFYNQKFLIEEQEYLTDFPTINRFIDKEMIFLEKSKEIKSKEEIIYEMYKKLLDFGYVEPEYYDSIIERETLGSTEVGNGAAVPHGSPKYVKKSVLGIYIFKEGFKWNENHIRMIILPCVEQKDILIIRELFHEILGFFGNIEIFKQAIEVTSETEFIQILEGDSYDKT